MGDIDRKDWEDHHCPGDEAVHCSGAGLAREAVRQARLDALEEAARAVERKIGETLGLVAIIRALKDKT